MATLAQRIIDLATAVGADVKTLTISQGVLTSLNTTAKGSLVAAINEVIASIGSAGAQINDTATNGATTVTWSADKIFDTIEAAKTAVKDELVNGSAAALDTLNELANALGNDPNFATTIATALTQRVRVDAVQTFTAPQQAQARSNIGALSTVEIGDPDTNFVTTYTAAKA